MRQRKEGAALSLHPNTQMAHHNFTKSTFLPPPPPLHLLYLDSTLFSCFSFSSYLFLFWAGKRSRAKIVGFYGTRRDVIRAQDMQQTLCLDVTIVVAPLLFILLLSNPFSAGRTNQKKKPTGWAERRQRGGAVCIMISGNLESLPERCPCWAPGLVPNKHKSLLFYTCLRYPGLRGLYQQRLVALFFFSCILSWLSSHPAARRLTPPNVTSAPPDSPPPAPS